MLNKKLVVLTALLTLFVASAASFNVNVDDKERTPITLEGGEENTINGSFNSPGDIKGAQVNLKVYSSEGMDGNEFRSFEGEAGSENLAYEGPVNLNESLTLYQFETDELDEELEEINFELNFTTALNIKPGNYSMNIEAGPYLGNSERKNATAAENGVAGLEVAGTKVNVKAREKSKVFAQSIDSKDLGEFNSPNENSKAIGGVTVTAPGNEGGNITFQHNENLDNSEIQVYYWDRKDGWTQDPVNVTEVNETHVTAEVEHFSTYAAYSETTESEESEEDNRNSGSSGGSSYVPPADDDEVEEVVADAGPNQNVDVGEEVVFNASNSSYSEEANFSWSLGDGETATGETVTYTYDESGTYTVTLNISSSGEYDTDSIQVNVRNPQNEEEQPETPGEPETGTDEGPENTPRGITGQFTESVTDTRLAGGIAMLVLIALLYLQSTGRLKGRSRLQSLQNRFSS